MDKNKWIDDVMDSTEGMQSATAPEGLFHKIEQKLAEGVAVVRTVPMRTVSLAAASIVLLVAVNVLMLSSDNQRDAKRSSNVERVIEFYGLNEQTIDY